MLNIEKLVVGVGLEGRVRQCVRDETGGRASERGRRAGAGGVRVGRLGGERAKGGGVKKRSRVKKPEVKSGNGEWSASE
jgi:hypothetical protein